jgi:hypothetical protein
MVECLSCRLKRLNIERPRGFTGRSAYTLITASLTTCPQPSTTMIKEPSLKNALFIFWKIQGLGGASFGLPSRMLCITLARLWWCRSGYVPTIARSSFTQSLLDQAQSILGARWCKVSVRHVGLGARRFVRVFAIASFACLAVVKALATRLSVHAALICIVLRMRAARCGWADPALNLAPNQNGKADIQSARSTSAPA